MKCIICLDIVEEPILTFCMHSSFCTGCLKRTLVESPRCPHCTTELNPDKDLFHIPVSKNFQELFRKTYVRSPKIQKLLDIVGDNPSSKIVVFSHFLSMMEMVQTYLKAQGVRLEYINGSTPEPKRKELIRNFKQDHQMHVLLISIEVGGFGLNLTEANIVVILEPLWNPAIYRPGESVQVQVYFYDNFEKSPKKIPAQMAKSNLKATLKNAKGQPVKTVKKAESTQFALAFEVVLDKKLAGGFYQVEFSNAFLSLIQRQTIFVVGFESPNEVLALDVNKDFVTGGDRIIAETSQKLLGGALRSNELDNFPVKVVSSSKILSSLDVLTDESGLPSPA